jgi:hypothetical protein
MKTKQIENITINELRQKPRVLVFAINTVLAWIVFFIVTGGISPFVTGAGIWLLAAIAYWLLVLITNPFFRPPKDSLATAISVVLLLIPIDFSGVLFFKSLLQTFQVITIVTSLAVTVLALIAIFEQTSNKNNPLGKISYQLSDKLGKGEILFTPVVLISALGFYQSNIPLSLIIAGFWVLMISIKPVELISKIFVYFYELKTGQQKLSDTIGSILRIDDPNIVRVILTNNANTWKKREVHLIHLPNDKYAYILPLFTQVQGESIIGTGLFSLTQDKPKFKTNSGEIYKYEDPKLAKIIINELCGTKSGNFDVVGLTVERSTIGSIKCQVIPGIPLEEGMILFANINRKKVYYQILDAVTEEESFVKNPFGMHIVSAAQLGAYDPKEGFEKFSWLPNMNQPLFLVPEDEMPKQVLGKNEFIIGKIPRTNFGVPVVLNDLIEYHTAILGITGTGKTELALDIVRNALDRGTKVFCVDFTGEYKPRLHDYNPAIIGLSIEQVKKMEEFLFAVETGTYGAPQEKATLKKFLDEIKPDVNKQIKEFIESEENNLGIFELAEITNTKATLRTTELYLSAIMDWAKENRKATQIHLTSSEIT